MPGAIGMFGGLRPYFHRSVRNPAHWIFWAFLAIYLADGRAHPEIDCVPAPYAAWSVVRTGSYDVLQFPELQKYHNTSCLMHLDDGRIVPKRSPGTTLAVVPMVAPFAIFRTVPFSSGTMHFLGKLAAAIHVAWAAGLLFAVAKHLAPNGAWPATILFGLGTCLYSVAAQAIWVHGPATFYLMLSLYFLIKAPPAPLPALLAGLALGLAVLNRPPTALFAIATGLALLIRWDRRVIPVTLGGSIPFAYLLWVNWNHFGTLGLGGYAPEFEIEPPPFWLGFFGLLIAPSRGLFVYSPAFLLLPLAIRTFRKPTETQAPQRALLFCWLIAAGATLILYARWYDWRGGWCYGPRFLCECLPILALLFALGADRFRDRFERIGVWILVILSVLIHMLGIYGGNEYEAWQKRHDPAARPDQGRCLFEFEDTQIEAHARGFWKKLIGSKPTE